MDNSKLSIIKRLEETMPNLVIIQLISIYRAIAVFIFVLFYTNLSNEMNSLLLITAILSDLLDGYLARKYQLTTIGGKLLDLFSDKYLNCILTIFLIIEKYPLLPLLMILTKEIFVLSFRSIELEGEFVISTNRTIGGLMSGALCLTVFFHINEIYLFIISKIVILLGIMNTLYLIYKIASNSSKLKKVFRK